MLDLIRHPFDALIHGLMLPFLSLCYTTVYPNYGVAIVLLTLMIKLLFFPLTQRQFKAMKITQKLQPEMKRLQETHKDDPKTLQKEMMALWKTHNANPFSGCLPLVIQLPFFFAIYSAISSPAFKSMIGAQGVNPGLTSFWLTNLSQPDPYFILPIAIVVLTWLSQRQMPMDPNQKLLMSILPLMMGMISFKLPAGVLIYWVTQQGISTLQQWWLLRESGVSPSSAAGSQDEVVITVKPKRKGKKAS